MFNRPKSPLFATINVTGNCNLNCNYCFNMPRENIDISIEDFKYALNILKKEEVFMIVLSGGEPFIHPKIDELIRLSHKKFSNVQILSNGTILTHENIKTIEKIVDEKGFFPIQISLDSYDNDINLKTRGESRTIIDNIKILNDIGATVTIATVITKHNIESIIDSIVNWIDLTKSFHIMQFKRQKFNLATDDIEVEYSRIEKLWEELDVIRSEHDLSMKLPSFDKGEPYCAEGAPCMAGFSHIVIDPNLKVRACDRCTTEFVGDLRYNSFQDIWKSKELKDVYSLEKPYCFY